MSLRELTRKATPIAVTICHMKQRRSTALKSVILRLNDRQTSDQSTTVSRAGMATQK
jgi:hypothetical protein